MDTLPITRIANIPPESPAERWLVDQLWAREAVGFIGGQPKSFKTWMALELGVAVASGKPCLGRFEVHQRGTVLLYAAEDSPAAIRERVAGIARARGVDLDHLGIGLIAEPMLRLDDPSCRARIDATLSKVRARLLILDPLVRLHTSDEDSSSEVSSLHGFLRAMQRKHHVAIAVVHHVRKTAGGSPGQALRGSGDLFAWLDSALYLVRIKGKLVLAPQHRNRPSADPMTIELRTEPTHLAILGDDPDSDAPMRVVEERLLNALSERGPLARVHLRAALRVRNETLGRTLTRLEAEGRIAQQGQRWVIPDSHPSESRQTGTAHER
jgi:hypothetical protein